MPDEMTTVMDNVRRALGRTHASVTAPAPPALDESVVRMVQGERDLPALFAKQAAEMKMKVAAVSDNTLVPALATFLRQEKCRTVCLPDSPLLERLKLVERLNQEGFTARCWSQMTADEAYEFDAGVTDAHLAVAETASIVIRPGPEHGRLVSLVPFVHAVILEPANFIADLFDLFQRLAHDREQYGSGYCLISGPSKTADIEMNVVTGVHGPNVVGAFILQG